ncbi:hypothetical protein [Chachezhania antarctica]|uniref:hypothetical protein n=1 Tax=Chachezhania antarctica TaxID=2340860 RepID=UPI001F092187|nr:hypothetical protein [Chachezhania antarctica]
MPFKQTCHGLCAGATLAAILIAAGAGTGAAQQQGRDSRAPMSAIDWLSQPSIEWTPGQPQVLKPRGTAPDTALDEPPVTEGISVPTVDVRPLGTEERAAGLVPPDVSGLPRDLWAGSQPEDLVRLISGVPVADNPAMQRLLYTLLLTEAYAPQRSGAEDILLTARLTRLMDLGAADPVRALADLSEPEQHLVVPGGGSDALRGVRDRFALRFDAALLTGEADAVCQQLIAMPELTQDYRAQIFCNARLGDWHTATLLFDMAETLDLIGAADLNLLARFLHPDLSEDADLLPPPMQPDALTFILYSAIGERLPTGRLPRVFANADLQDLAGWKAQIEAAERLTRSGAVSPNRLLGLYTDRRPSASGGVWDRVDAIQRFDGALADGNGALVAELLPEVWQAMTDEGLGPTFATLFAHRLAAIRLPDVGEARWLAWKIRLLSPDYAAAAATPPDDSPRTQFLAALARGVPQSVPAPDARAQAIADGFTADGAVPSLLVPASMSGRVSDGRLGETILKAMTRFASGLQGNDAALTEALAILRSVGQEDAARRAALQALLMERG